MPQSPPATPRSPRGDLIPFMVIAFVTSWALWFATMAIGGPAVPGEPAFTPYVLGAFGPLVAAAVVRFRRRRRGEPLPAHAVRFRRSTLLWTPLLLVLAADIVLAGGFLAGVAGAAPTPSLDSVARVIEQYPMSPLLFFVNLLVAGPLAEEPGWRGTAYPRMRASMGRFQASIVLGVVWAVWHLPLFFVTGTIQNQLGLATPSGVLFAVSSVPMAMLACYAYERAGVAAAVAVHFATNLTMTLLVVSAPTAQALIMGIQAVVATCLLASRRSVDNAADQSGTTAGSTAASAGHVSVDGRREPVTRR